MLARVVRGKDVDVAADLRRDSPAAKRPANSHLSCQRVEKTFGVSLPHWEHTLSLVLETLTEGSSTVSSKL